MCEKTAGGGCPEQPPECCQAVPLVTLLLEGLGREVSVLAGGGVSMSGLEQADQRPPVDNSFPANTSSFIKG